MVEVKLYTPSPSVKIDGKEYSVSFSEDGIFIQSDKGVKVTKVSQTSNWLFVK